MLGNGGSWIQRNRFFIISAVLYIGAAAERLAGEKLTKNEVLLTKQIASLRIHIERVIKRLREFNLIKPFSCVHHDLIKYLDQILVVACGVVNLQTELIKSE